MLIAHAQIESNLRLHVDRLAGLIGPRTLRRPKTITATIGYIESQWAEMGYTSSRECYDALGDEATNLIVERPGTKRSAQTIRSYVCFPMLDVSTATADELRQLATDILGMPKPVLIHCAQGHGRTGLVASAVLLVSGRAQTASDAIAMVQAARPGIELNRMQYSILEQLQ
jgi:protein-tyrosine phosphatase